MPTTYYCADARLQPTIPIWMESVFGMREAGENLSENLMNPTPGQRLFYVRKRFVIGNTLFVENRIDLPQGAEGSPPDCGGELNRVLASSDICHCLCCRNNRAAGRGIKDSHLGANNNVAQRKSLVLNAFRISEHDHADRLCGRYADRYQYDGEGI